MFWKFNYTPSRIDSLLDKPVSTLAVIYSFDLVQVGKITIYIVEEITTLHQFIF